MPIGHLLCHLAVSFSLVAFLAGCSFSGMHPSLNLNEPGVVVKRELVVDETQARLGCGLDAVLAAGKYFGLEENGELPLSPRMREHLADGSTPVELLIGAREAGMNARIVRGTPEELELYAVDDDIVPVIMMNAALSPQEILRLKQLGIPFLPDPSPTDQPHWLIVAGIQEQGDAPPKFVVLSSEEKRYAIPQQVLVPRWEMYDYCTILLSPPENARLAK